MNSDATTAALVGALIGSFSMGIVNYVLDTGRRCIRTKSLCLGLAAELETIWGQHTRNCGTALMQVAEGAHFTGYYPIGGDYFVNYHANASDLGELRSTELRANIVATYSELKGLIDSFQLYNELLMGRLGTQNALTTREYTEKLKRMNAHLDEAIPRLVTDLKNAAEIP